MTTTLTTPQIAMLPTHDPLVGRTVGTMLQYFGPKAKLTGKINGTDDINLTYAKAADGSVTCDGFFGAVEIHETLTGRTTDSSGGSSLFGVAGTSSKTQAATDSGTIAGQFQYLDLTVERHTQEVPMTDELRARGTSTMTMNSQVLSSPSFGGAQVITYLVPGRFPTESPVLQTQDAITVRGNSAGAAILRQFQWNMTTWTKGWNDMEGWGHTEMLQAEDAQETESFVAGQENTHTDKPLDWHVTPYHAVASGKLVTERPNEAPQTRALTRDYQYDLKTNTAHVHEEFGDTRVDFDIAKA